jgi:reverse gyrase
MPIYNDIKQCQNCGKILTEKETARINNKKTLRFCDKCWPEAVILMEKIKPLWNL